MVDDNQLLDRFRTLSVWNKAGQRAPHKPLLCLLAISLMVHEGKRLLRFREIEKRLCDLLVDFGPPRKVCHPEYPFWCLQNDENVWEVERANAVPSPAGGAPTRATLIRCDVRGGFSKDVYNTLRNNDELRRKIVSALLDAHFPDTFQEDICRALNLATELIRKERDSQFRDKVLSAYEYRCAICGFNVRLGHVVIALEAAHIKWHQAGGPNVQENGLALCSLHHKLFDRGAFTLGLDNTVLISERAYGTHGFDEHLGRFHRKGLICPVRESYRPNPEYQRWHRQQVFMAPERE